MNLPGRNLLTLCSAALAEIVEKHINLDTSSMGRVKIERSVLWIDGAARFTITTDAAITAQQQALGAGMKYQEPVQGRIADLSGGVVLKDLTAEQVRSQT